LIHKQGAPVYVSEHGLDQLFIGNNNGENPFLFRDTMLKLIHSENLEYKELTKAA